MSSLVYSTDKMNPKYKYKDFVEFEAGDEIYSGEILSFHIENDEPIYDISGKDLEEAVIFTDIKESQIQRRIVHTVLCYIERNNKYLMLLRNKRKNDYNKDKWIGIGGHLLKNEEPEDALLREVKEETGLELLDYEFKALLYFHDTSYLEIIHLYTSKFFSGFVRPCDEGTLAWIEKDKIFDLNLWEGDRIFLKDMMEDKEPFTMHLYYEDGKFIRSEKL